MKEKVKTLWKLCFDDSEIFTDLYFRLRYSNEVNIAIQSGEEVIAALQMIPYPMTFCNKIVQTAYLSGVCTHPDYRNKGVMRELLHQTFARLWQRHIPISTLIPAEPWLFDYYSRMGYAPVFHASQAIVDEGSLQTNWHASVLHPTGEIRIVSTTKYDEQHYQFLNRKLAEHSCCIQHTADDYKMILEALALENDSVHVAIQNYRVSGMAVTWKTENGITIDALLADDKASEQALLRHIYKVMKDKEIILMTPPPHSGAAHTFGSTHSGSVHPFGMARIIRAEELLTLYAAARPELRTEFELTDPQLSSNNGYYHIENGSCRKETLPSTPATKRLTIGELAGKLFTPCHPYMNLMLNH